jgi:hypothetical protein
MRMMAPSNPAGVQPSPTTQLFGGNAGGGMAGGLPTEKKKPAAQAGLSSGATPTFAQMQQQGQARPAPSLAPQAQGAAQPQQPAMLSALGAQLGQADPKPQFAQPAAGTQGLDKVPANVMESLNQNEAWKTGAGYAQGTLGGGGVPNTNFMRDAEGNTTITVRDEEGGSQQYSSAQAQPQQGAQAQPSAYQSSGAFGGSAQAQALRAKLEQQLNDLSQNEAQIQGQSYEALRKAKMDEMGAEFGAQRSQIEEDLARRGLSASTIGGGRYGDLAGQQARATASFEADLLRQQAEAEAKNRQMYLSGMSDLAGMAGQQDLGAFEANLKSRQVDADISFRGQELQQEAALRGRELTLQEARDLATKEYQGGQLQQGYAEIGSRERISANELATRESMQTQQQQFDRSQSVLERNLREKMQTQQLTSEEQRQLNQIDANKALQTDSQTFQAGQSQLERGLRETMQTRELTAAEQRQLAGIEADKAAAGVRSTFESGEATARRTFEGAQSQLDRDLRSTLSTAEIGAAQKRFDATYGLDKERFGFEKGQSQNQFLGSLASVLAPMDQKKRDEFLAGLGITIPKNPAAGSVSGTTTGGGYGNDTGI